MDENKKKKQLHCRTSDILSVWKWTTEKIDLAITKIVCHHFSWKELELSKGFISDKWMKKEREKKEHLFKKGYIIENPFFKIWKKEKT